MVLYLFGCLATAGIGVQILVEISRFHHHYLGEGARNRLWIENHKEFSGVATNVCRNLEEQMIANRYRSQVQNPDYELQSLDLRSIRFAEAKYYDYNIDRLRFYLDAKQPINANDFDVVLRWYRQFRYKGTSPPLFFDPHYDIEVTCFVSRNPGVQAVIASEYLGQ